MTTPGSREGASRRPNDTDKVVGQNIRTLRLQRKQTLNDLAGALGISHQQLQKYETGENRLAVGMAAKAADELGVPIEHLFRKGSAAGERGQDTQTRLMEELRQEGAYYLGRAGTPDSLRQMVEVLRVLSS